MKKKIDLNKVFRDAVLKNYRCTSCGRSVRRLVVEPHPGGIMLKDGSDMKVWVCFECDRCGYQSAMWKILKTME